MLREKPNLATNDGSFHIQAFLELDFPLVLVCYCSFSFTKPFTMSDSTLSELSSTQANHFDILPLSELNTFVKGYDYEYDKKTGLYYKKESK